MAIDDIALAVKNIRHFSLISEFRRRSHELMQSAHSVDLLSAIDF